MIILFHLKLDKFYCIGDMNQLKVICCVFIKKILLFSFYHKNELYWFNKKEILQKAKEKYDNCGGKEKAAKYYQGNKDVLKEKARNSYKNLSEEEKEAKKEY